MVFETAWEPVALGQAGTAAVAAPAGCSITLVARAAPVRPRAAVRAAAIRRLPGLRRWVCARSFMFVVPFPRGWGSLALLGRRRPAKGCRVRALFFAVPFAALSFSAACAALAAVPAPALSASA